MSWQIPVWPGDPAVSKGGQGAVWSGHQPAAPLQLQERPRDSGQGGEPRDLLLTRPHPAENQPGQTIACSETLPTCVISQLYVSQTFTLCILVRIIQTRLAGDRALNYIVHWYISFVLSLISQSDHLVTCLAGWVEWIFTFTLLLLRFGLSWHLLRLIGL